MTFLLERDLVDWGQRARPAAVAGYYCIIVSYYEVLFVGGEIFVGSGVLGRSAFVRSIWSL